MPDEFLTDGMAQLQQAEEAGNTGRANFVRAMMMIAANCKGEEHQPSGDLAKLDPEKLEAALKSKNPLFEILALLEEKGLPLDREALADFFKPEIPAYKRNDPNAEPVGALYAMIDQALEKNVEPQALNDFIMKTIKGLEALEEKGMLPEINGRKVSVLDDFINAVTEVTLEVGSKVKKTTLDLVNDQCQKCRESGQTEKVEALESLAASLKEKGAKTSVELEQGLMPIPGEIANNDFLGPIASAIAGMSAGKRGGLFLNAGEIALILSLMKAAEAAAQAQVSGGGGAPRPDLKSLMKELNINPKQAERAGLEEKVNDLEGIVTKDNYKAIAALLEKMTKKGIRFDQVVDLDTQFQGVNVKGKFVILEMPENMTFDQIEKLRNLMNAEYKKIDREGDKSPNTLQIYRKEDGVLTLNKDDAGDNARPLLAVPERFIANKEFANKMSEIMGKMDVASEKIVRAGATR